MPQSSRAAQARPSTATEIPPESFYLQPQPQDLLYAGQSSTPTSHTHGFTGQRSQSTQEQPLREQTSYVSSEASYETEYAIDQHGTSRLETHEPPTAMHSTDDQESYLPSTVTVRRGSTAGPDTTTRAMKSEDSDSYSNSGEPAEHGLPEQYSPEVLLPSHVPSVPESHAAAMASAQATAGVAFSEPADYEGAGYGRGINSRHYHESRLSDVLEEDERSRTTAE